MFIPVCALAGILQVSADDGELLGETAEAVDFELRTAASIYVVSSRAELEALGDVTWRKGETVTVAKHDGMESFLVKDAPLAGSGRPEWDEGGVWVLRNSMQGSVKVGIPWAVFGGGDGPIGEGSATIPFLDTCGTGPDRRIKTREAYAIAYSGDGWRGASDAGSVLTLTKPDGIAEISTFSGSGSIGFRPGLRGVWKAELTSDGKTLVSEITVMNVAMTLFIR